MSVNVSFDFTVSGFSVTFTDTSSGFTPIRWDWYLCYLDGSGVNDHINSTQSTTFLLDGGGSGFPRVYSVTLIVYSSDGVVGTISRRIDAADWGAMTSPAVPSYSYVVTGGSVAFTDTSSGPVAGWEWDGGNINNSSPTITFPNSDHSVVMEIFNTSTVVSGRVSRQGPSPTYLRTSLGAYSIFIDPVVSAFTWSPEPKIGPGNVSFTKTSGGSTQLWDFGDGNTSTSASPTHSYAAIGTYTVTFTSSTIIGSGTFTDTITHDVHVIAPPPAAGFTADKGLSSNDAQITGQAVNFTDESTGSPSTWAWDFGDGGTSSEQNPTHTYSTSGTYTVTETVS